MWELSPFYLPFIPAKYYASLLPSYAYLLKVRCASIVVWDAKHYSFATRISSGLHLNHYWFTLE